MGWLGLRGSPRAQLKALVLILAGGAVTLGAPGDLPRLFLPGKFRRMCSGGGGTPRVQDTGIFLMSKDNPGYLEPKAKVSLALKSLEKNVSKPLEKGFWPEKTCDKSAHGWFITAECEDGHRYAKDLVCGKEWCEVCGQDGSSAHGRRVARWLPKVQQTTSLGYFVLTIPEELRSQYRTKKALAWLDGQVCQLLKSYGYLRGLRRWHFFGDRSTKYNPHLNCLVDGGYVDSGKLDAIKAAYANILGVDMADVYYSYRVTPGQMVHTLNYVTRATFHDYHWSIELALELRGFRNMKVWGRGLWDGEPSWTLESLHGKARVAVADLDVEAIECLAHSICPECGKPLTWGKVLPVGLLDMVEKQSLGAGYYRLANVKAPWRIPEEASLRLHWLEMVKKAELYVGVERLRREVELSVCKAQFVVEWDSGLWRSVHREN